MNGINASISGMNTAARRLAITANNVANVQTDGYQAKRAISGETAGGGVDIVEIQTTGAESGGGSNVDLTTEIAHQIIDSNTYEANAKMFTAQNDTVGMLLDLIE